MSSNNSPEILDRIATAEEQPVTMRELPTGDLHANDYNPNQMTVDEFAELVAEVKHLGRLPKPVIVRPNNDGYQIVDGEHGWRAAKEVDLPTVPCEVIEADDFEAMRQTFKRNQHGEHNPILLGQMFSQMMADRKLSRRKLAEEIGVSEGTIRNSLAYTKAAEVRNDYAPKKISSLTIKQVRLLNRLPKFFGNVWLSSGADLKQYFGVKTMKEVDCQLSWGRDKNVADRLARLEDTGLTQFLKPGRGCTAFQDAVKAVKQWNEWEKGWAVGGIDRDELRQYTRHHFSGVWYVKDAWGMDCTLGVILDPSSGTFLLSPEEFSACIEAADAVPSSRHDFEQRLELAIVKKGLELPESKYEVQKQLQLIEMDRKAPDFIKDSKLSTEEKYAIWKTYQDVNEKEEGGGCGYKFEEDESPEMKNKTLRELAKSKSIQCERRESHYAAIRRLMTVAKRHRKDVERWQEWLDSKTEANLADEIVDGFYDDKDPDLKDGLRTIEPCIANDRRASNGSPDVQVPAGTTGSLAMQTSISWLPSTRPS